MKNYNCEPRNLHPAPCMCVISQNKGIFSGTKPERICFWKNPTEGNVHFSGDGKLYWKSNRGFLVKCFAFALTSVISH